MEERRGSSETAGIEGATPARAEPSMRDVALRAQVSAAHTHEDLAAAVDAFVTSKAEVS